MPSKNTRKGICPRCKRTKAVNYHHILPQVHFNGDGEKVSICYDCHRIFENVLSIYEGKSKNNKRIKLPIHIYRDLFALYIEASEN